MILSGYQPFEDENVPKLISKITLGEFDISQPIFSHISKDAKELICKLLDISPAIRPTAKQVLEHSWFQKTDFDQEGQDTLQNVSDKLKTRKCLKHEG